MKVVRNDVMNIFELNDQFFKIYTVFTPRASEVGKIQPFCRKKIGFWSNLEAPREKTLHFRELVMVFKVLVNNIVNIINLDQNTVRSNLKELCKI